MTDSGAAAEWDAGSQADASGGADRRVGVTLGLDVGERRIGVAIGDPSGTLASPLTTVIRTSDRAAVTAIGELVVQHGAGLIVVGLPLSAVGAMTEQAGRTMAFGYKLRAIPEVRVVFWDEQFSTATAEAGLYAMGHSVASARTPRQREGERRRLDAAAAAVILQSYLDRQPN